MNIQQLLYFVELKRYGSINKTAQVLHVSQPWLSKTLKELETELGVDLYLRNSTGITITRDGEALINQVSPIVQELEIIKKQYKENSSDNQTIHLRIASGRYSFATRAFIEYHKRYVDTADEAAIEVFEGSCIAAVEDVYSKKAELGIIHVHAISGNRWKKQLEAKMIDYHYLGSAKMCVFLRKEHPLLRIKDLKMQDLFPYTLLYTMGKDSQFNNYDEEPCSVPYDDFHKNIYASSRQWAFSVLEHTDSIYLGLENEAFKELNPGLTLLKYPGEEVSYDIYWLKLKDRTLSKEAKHFLDILVKTKIS